MQWFPPIDVLKSALPDNVIVQRQQKMNSYVIAYRAVVIFYIYIMAVYFYNSIWLYITTRCLVIDEILLYSLNTCV